MNPIRTIVAATILLGLMSSLAPGSSRVGNGILPSLRYRCIPSEAIFAWCRMFESLPRAEISSFPEGVSFYFNARGGSDPRRRAVSAWILRSGDRLRYQFSEAFQDPVEARRYFDRHAKSARPLVDDFFYFEIMDDEGYTRSPREQVRIVVRPTHDGIILRREGIRPRDEDFTERSYLKLSLYRATASR